ncbi:NACHT domain-containing protein [Actinoplanes sp. NPDC000266]
MGRATAQVVLGVVGGMIIVPVAVNVATGGELPGALRPFGFLLWPAAALCLLLIIVLGLGDRRRPPPRRDDPRNAGLALARVAHYVEQRRSGLLSARIPLTLDERPGAVRRPVHLVQRIGGTEFQISGEAGGVGVIDVFDQMSGSMLILGAPGAGKTTQLLDLAAALLDREGERIPVVLDLADWSQPRWSWRRPDRAPDDFRRWLESQLDDRYRIPAAVARAWLDDDRFVLLFDGLDEVRESYRDRCVSEINKLEAASVVVCSREADYERLTERLRLQGAVVIRPLAGELLTTPLMFDVVRMAGGGRDTGALFDAYIVEMLARRRGQETESPERALRAVRALAQASVRLDAGARVARLNFVTLGEALDEPAAQVARRRLLPLGGTIGAIICSVTMALFAGWVPGMVVAAVSAAPLVMWRPEPPSARWRFRWPVVIVYALAVAVTGSAVSAALVWWSRHSTGSWQAATVIDILIALVAVAMVARAGFLGRRAFVLLLAYGVVAAVLVAWRGLGPGAQTGLVVGVLTATNLALFSLTVCFPSGPPQRRHLPTRLAVLAITAAPLLATSTWWTAASGPALGGFAAGLFAGLSFGAFFAVVPAPGVLAWVALRAVGEPYPWRPGLLRFAADRSLLVDTDEGHRFVHLLIRNHLAACDPAELGAAVERRRAER